MLGDCSLQSPHRTPRPKHRRPDGDPTTRVAGKLPTVRMLDHLIFNDRGFRSMLEEDELIS